MAKPPSHFLSRPPMPGAEASAAFDALFDRSIASGPNALIEYDLPLAALAVHQPHRRIPQTHRAWLARWRHPRLRTAPVA